VQVEDLPDINTLYEPRELAQLFACCLNWVAGFMVGLQKNSHGIYGIWMNVSKGKTNKSSWILFGSFGYPILTHNLRKLVTMLLTSDHTRENRDLERI
jgi:hypothetical protein